MIRQNSMIKCRALIFILSLGAALIATTSVRAATDSEAAIIERIKPVGVVCVAGENCDQAAAPAPIAAAGPAAAARSGEAIYNQSCVVCHGAGIAGAPKLGDKGIWAGRIAKGMDALIASSISGINAMPPRGTCMDCSDQELEASVQFMVDASQ